MAAPEPGRGAKPNYPEQNLVKGRTPAGYAYLGGGHGVDEKKALERLSAAYNIKMLFARHSGTPISQARLLIRSNNSQRMDNIVASGPVFYMQLPPGAYTLVARFKTAVVLLRDVRVIEGERRTLVFRGD